MKSKKIRISKLTSLHSQMTHGVRPCKTKGDYMITWGDNL
jgi:hypothetical protein